MTNAVNQNEIAITRARQLADDVLFPNANAVDRSGELPVAQLDRLVAEGLYGLAGPASLGGVGVDRQQQWEIVEALAGGCLTTAFVWVQHQNAVGLAAKSTGDFHNRWARPLAQGEIKAGVAFAHMLRPNVVIGARLADPDDPTAGWVINGTAPWVTGWGYIDIVSVAARHVDESGELVGGDRAGEGGSIVWLFDDAVASTSRRATRLDLSAVDASSTYAVEYSEHHVAANRVALIQPYIQWRADYAKGLRANAALGLGICERTARLLAEVGLADAFRLQLDDVRSRLDGATEQELPTARADLSTLAIRMTAALVAAQGGRSVAADHHGQRLAREAVFLLIQGQTAEIKRHQVESLVAQPDLG